MQDACRDSYFRSRVKKAESSKMASIGEVSEDSILLQKSVIHGHHVFKEIWTPRVSEILLVNQERSLTDVQLLCNAKSRQKCSQACA